MDLEDVAQDGPWSNEAATELQDPTRRYELGGGC